MTPQRDEVYNYQTLGKYLNIEVLHKQTTYHKVFLKKNKLRDDAKRGAWEECKTVAYNRLDDIITDSMWHAGKSTTRVYSKTYDWSPALAIMLNGP